MSSEQTVRRYAPCAHFHEGDIYCAEMLETRHGEYVHASDYDALSTELAEAKAEIERMREALQLYKTTRKTIIEGRLASWSVVDKAVAAALIPAKGKGE